MAESEQILDPSQSYPQLAKAPIVEAVVAMRAVAMKPWHHEGLRSSLEASLPDYGTVKSLHGFEMRAKIKLDRSSDEPPAATFSPVDRGDCWKGYRIESSDGQHIATFARDGFSFSRLAPYRDWSTFTAEALRLWAIYADVAGPDDVERLGVRFINRLEVPIAGLDFSEYLRNLATPPANLPVGAFMYRDTLSVPEHGLAVNLIRTFQPPAEGADKLALLLDIDVFATERLGVGHTEIQTRLNKMQILKNRVFFESVTPQFLELCQ